MTYKANKKDIPPLCMDEYEEFNKNYKEFKDNWKEGKGQRRDTIKSTVGYFVTGLATAVICFGSAGVGCGPAVIVFLGTGGIMGYDAIELDRLGREHKRLKKEAEKALTALCLCIIKARRQSNA